MWQSIKNIYHLFVAVVANVVYGFPSRKLTVIGVTGTDGKTTTTNIIYHILNSAGKKAAMVSTVGAAIGNQTFDIGFHVTTPSSFAIQEYLRLAASRGCKYMVLEVTSHALDQNRVFGVNFAIGVLTNITHEHLDYHKTYERYVKTKCKLLKAAKVSIVNKDDSSYERINSKLKIQSSKVQLKSQKFITYGLTQDSDINPKVFSFKTNLFGEFNQYNCLAAIAVCKELGLSDEQIRKGLSTFRAPTGRQDIVYPSAGSGQADFTVMIDFAHTPNAFAKLLPEVKKATKGKVIHVFGAAGKRDTSKRPEMGKVASEFDDIIILTSEDPRGEPVENINKEITVGIKNYELRIKNKTLIEIANRKEAIAFAISLAKKGDFVLLTGKSHEKSMNYQGIEEAWDEFAEVQSALRKRKLM